MYMEQIVRKAFVGSNSSFAPFFPRRRIEPDWARIFVGATIAKVGMATLAAYRRWEKAFGSTLCESDKWMDKVLLLVAVTTVAVVATHLQLGQFAVSMTHLDFA